MKNKLIVKTRTKMRKKQFPTVSGLILTWNRKSILTIKLIALVLLFPIFRTFALNDYKVYGEDIQFTFKMENVPMKTVLRSIEEQTEFSFVYNSKLVDVNRKVNIDVSGQNIDEVLDKLFADTNINYEIVDRHILLSVKNIDSKTVNQQQATVRGRVQDTQGNPLPGVTVVVKGTTQGTITDTEGRYSLPNVPNDAVLVFSFVGMQTLEIPVSGKQQIDVAMEEETIALGEVVVVGYGTQKKINLTGAVGVATEEVLQDRPISNIGQGLQGVIPNLQVNQNNYAPGIGSSFNVRGFTSINGGEPLILVDGVVQDPNLINPNDVESISVLKDAASAAIYGARSAYGVILITTKKGKKEQKPTLNVSSSHSVTSATNIPKYADSWEYITYMNTASKNAGGSNYFDQRLMDHALKYYEDPINNLPVYYDPAIDTDGKYKYCGNTDWAKELYKNSALSQINANISGGSDKTQYYVSYGFMNQGGFLRSYNDSYKRHNISVNVNTEVLDWLTFSVRSRYTYGKEDHPSGGSNGNSGISEYSGQLKNDLRPIMPVKHPDGNWAGQGQFTNPFAVGAEGGYDKRKVNDFWITGAITIKPIKDLNINIDYTYNPYSWNKERTSRLFYEYWAEPGKYNIYPWTSPNLVILENSNDYYQALNSYLDYTKNVNNHNIKFLLGYNHEIKNNKWFYAKRENLIDNDLPAINRAIGEDYVDGSETSWAVQGVFFRINYDFLEKYLLELNGRYDGSSKFPKDDRYSFFPSISGGWRFSEETFWENIKPVVNEAKIRLSYGSLGNQNVASNFPYISDYNINTSMDYILGNERPVGVSPGALVSPNFTWEKVYQWNIGGDVGFLENQLTASFDIYRRDTQGMLTEGKPLPAVLGTNVPRENAADLKTYGWESTIEWKQRINEFGYRISFNISDYQSEITKFDNPTGDLNNYYVGRKIGEIWGYHAEGLFQSAQEIENHVSQAKLYGGTWNPGDVKYINLNDDDEISWGTNTLKDHGDLSIIGNNTPRYQYGLILAADWKGFDLNIFFQGIGKRDLWTGNNRFFGIGSEWDVPMKATLDYWTPENSNARLPRPYINGGHGNRYTSTLYLQNGAYLRLKQLTIGYTLPKNLTQKIAISKARFYLTGQNLLTLTKLNELYDPENLDLMGYPVPKAFSFGLNLTF